jgi:hypothetical protein
MRGAPHPVHTRYRVRQYLHFGVILQLAQNLISLGCGQLFAHSL